MTNRKVIYESELIVPEEILKSIEIMTKRILESHNENDKILCNIESFKGEMIRWFAGHQKES